MLLVKCGVASFSFTKPSLKYACLTKYTGRGRFREVEHLIGQIVATNHISPS